jgi:SAM-dependent methyltransferase
MARLQQVETVFDAEAEVYRKMVAHNYLNHAEVYACLHDRLKQMTKFRFLDVGCWNGERSAQVLAGTNVASYHGVDIVGPALDQAQLILSSKLVCPIRLLKNDYVKALAEWAEPVDVVWIGLSLHHQQTAGKLAVMCDIFRILSDDGVLLIYENTSPDGEDRSSWLERWDQQKATWKEYTCLEWETMRAHVRTYDFPEMLSVWSDLGRAAGFASASELYCCPTDLFRMFEFRKRCGVAATNSPPVMP